LRTMCSGWLQILILLISASWVARITGLSHQHLAGLYFWGLSNILCSRYHFLSPNTPQLLVHIQIIRTKKTKFAVKNLRLEPILSVSTLSSEKNQIRLMSRRIKAGGGGEMGI
jgi:hypothetical protein